MDLYNENLQREAENAYKKFIKSSKGLFGINKQKSGLESFKSIQKQEQAYNSSVLGIRDVRLEQIEGSVEKYKDFDKNFVPKNEVIKERWTKIYVACMKEESLPPVILYKIKDTYYVYDGNHRVSVAKFLNFPTIEAEVTEFLPSGEDTEDLVYRERFIFEKETDIQDIIFTEHGKYERLDTEIKSYKEFLEEKKALECTYKEAARYWYRDIFKSITGILESNSMTEYYEGFNINDLFIFVLDHKYFISREKQGDQGYLYAVIYFVNMVKTNEDISLANKCIIPDERRKDFLKLRKTDREMKLPRERIEGNEILLKITGIDFEYNDFTYEMIENFRKIYKIETFANAVKKWYEEVYIHILKYFLIKVKKLPEKYSRYLKLFTGNDKKIFESIYNFRRLHYYYGDKGEERLVDWKNTILNYIVEIYINIIDGIAESSVSYAKAIDVYYTVEKEYFYLLKNEKILASEKKNLNYSKIKEVESIFSLNWFGKKFRTDNVSEILTDERYDEFQKKFTSKKNLQKFEKIYYKYDGINIYSTFSKLEKAMKITGEKEFIFDLERNMKTLSGTGYVVKNYKTIEILRSFDKEKENMSFLDFYAKILDHGVSASPDFLFLNILDIALDYLNNCKNIESCVEEQTYI